MFHSVLLACPYGEEDADTNDQLTGHICADVTHLSNRLHQASQRITEALSPGLKWPGREVDHSPPSSTGANSELNSTPSPPSALIVCIGRYLKSVGNISQKRKSQPVRSRYIWEYNIKTDIKKVGCDGVD
jgi:hypothetical protein